MELKEIRDNKIWDEFVTTHESSFFQSSYWGDFQRSLGNKVFNLGFFEGETLKVVALAILVNAKRGKYLYIRNGPVSQWENEELIEDTFRLLEEFARSHRVWFLRVSPLVEKDSKLASIFQKRKYPISQMSDLDALNTWVLDLTQSEEDILKNMRKSTKQRINQAEKFGVEILSSSEKSALGDFYPIYIDTIKRNNWNGYSKEYIEKQFDEFDKDKKVKVYLAKYDGKMIAGSIFLYYGDTCYYHYAGSLSEYRNISATALIQWENIKYAKSIGMKKYNFWGISPENRPNHPWKGLTEFKMGFGGYANRWFETRDIPLNWKYWITNLFERYDGWKKGY